MHKVVGIIGSGNWGTAIAKLLANNLTTHKEYNKTIYMWTFEEMIDGKRLTEIINSQCENTKYLPGIKLTNVIAVPDLLKVTEMADVLVFVLPHQFIEKTLSQMKGHIKKHAVAVSLIKGLLFKDKFVTISELIERELEIPCGVLMGANIAIDVAKGYVAEGTLACRDDHVSKIIFSLFNSFEYRVTRVNDLYGVELAGTLKNVVSIAYGIAEGLNLSSNTSVAILRAGLNEMKKFMEEFFNANPMVLFESSGIADLLVSCLKGRNYRCGIEIAKGKKIPEIEAAMNGQKLQGTLTAKEIYQFLDSKNYKDNYPLFVTVYRICFEDELCDSLIGCIPFHK